MRRNIEILAHTPEGDVLSIAVLELEQAAALVHRLRPELGDEFAAITASCVDELELQAAA